MFKRLRRWHFDVLFFMGLALLTVCWWFHPRQPRWESPIRIDSKENAQLHPIGFTMDGKWFLTCKRIHKPVGVKQSVLIQRWDVATGSLLLEYPLFDDVESALVLSGDQLYTNRTLSGEQLLTVNESASGSARYRFYDVLSGKCINPQHQFRMSPNGIPPLFSAGAEFCLQMGTKVNEASQVFSPQTNELLTVLPPAEGMKLDYVVHQVPARQLLALWSAPFPERRTVPPILHVYDQDTWTRVQELTLPCMPFGVMQMVAEEDGTVNLRYLTQVGMAAEQNSFKVRLDQLKKNYVLGEMVTTPTRQQVARKLAPYATAFVDEQFHSLEETSDSLIVTVNQWLNRIRLRLRLNTAAIGWEVMDLETGSLSRQLNDIKIEHMTLWELDRHGKYVIGLVCADTPPVSRVEYSLICYVIPPWWYDTGIRWAQHVAWALVLIWPMRYLVRSRSLLSPMAPPSTPSPAPPPVPV